MKLFGRSSRWSLWILGLILSISILLIIPTPCLSEENHTLVDGSYSLKLSDVKIHTKEIDQQIANDQELTETQTRINTILRSFSHLPEEELMRFNISLTDDYAEGSENANKLFDAWNIRQQELKEAMQSLLKPAEYMANITEYLQKPSVSVETKAQLLVDLESLLSDIDNARDFHTLGAWPILVSFLYPNYPLPLISRAAWAIGSAIKHDNDYQKWVLESVTLLSPDGKQFQTNAMQLLFTALISFKDHNATNPEVIEYQKFVIYAISSALRNNPLLQNVLTKQSSVRNLLIDSFYSLLKDDQTHSSVKRKVFTLIADILMESTPSTTFSTTNDAQKTDKTIDNLTLGQSLIELSLLSPIQHVLEQYSKVLLTEKTKENILSSSDELNYLSTLDNLFETLSSLQLHHEHVFQTNELIPFLLQLQTISNQWKNYVNQLSSDYPRYEHYQSIHMKFLETIQEWTTLQTNQKLL